MAWATALPQLRSLLLGGNRLQGPVPLRLLLLEKKALGGGGNQLRLPASPVEGLLPASLALATIDLRDQGLVGPLPAAFLQLPGLRRLDLSGANALDGALPAAALQLLSSAAAMNEGEGEGEDGQKQGKGRSLRLGGGKGNRNAFRLPGGEELLRLAASHQSPVVTRIDLRASCLVGTIPRELGGLTTLTHLVLAGNALEGEVGDGLATLVSLEVLDLSDNRLRGPLPAWLGDLPRLRVLDLSANKLRGPIPERLFGAAAASLEMVRLAGNELQGALPESVGQLTRLRELVLADNQLVGDVPPALFRLGSLRVLDLSRQKQLQVRTRPL